MRRSEAVLVIAESLVEPRYHDPMEEASHILSRLEARGIVPPKYLKCATLLDLLENPSHQVEDVEVHEWEEE